MKNRRVLTLVIALLLLALGAPARAAESKVMVLSAQGGGMVKNGSQSTALRTGLVITAGSSIEVADKAKISFLVLPGGQRQEVTGKATLTVSAAGLQATSGTLVNAGARAVSLVPTGQNMRHMGGGAVRDENDPWKDRLRDFRNFKVQAIEGGARLQVSFDSDQSGPLLVTVFQSDGWNGQHLTLASDGGLKIGHRLEDPVDEVILCPTTSLVQSGTHFQAELPVSKMPAGTCRVEVRHDNPVAKNLSRFRVLSESEKKSLDAAVSQLSKWSEQEPQNVEPYVMLMATYDDYDQLDLALQSGLKALKLAPNDPGIQEEVSRLYLDLGDKTRAETYFRQSVASK